MKLEEFFEKFPRCNAYSNKLFINEILLPMYGDYIDKVLDWITPEVGTKDIEGNLIFIDFVITTKTAKYAIEVDDFQTHGAHISPEQQSKDYLKKDSLRQEYNEKFIVIPKYDIDVNKNRAFNTLWKAFRADPDLNRNCGVEITPHQIQKETLKLLRDGRINGKKKGLVCYATGLGKTYLSAFDVKQVIGEKKNDGGRALFLVHRGEILKKAEEDYGNVLPNKTKGRYNADIKNTTEDIIFASIQTIYKKENLSKFSKNHFDYIIMDETHHASDENITYKNILDYFNPKFLLGLTATPTRSDDFDILNNIYDGNLVYEISQNEAIENGYLVPCTYSYLSDNIDYTNIKWLGKKYYEEDLNEKLIVPKRNKKIIEEYKSLYPKPKKTLAFCVGIKHAEKMAQEFNDAGLKSRAIHSGNNDFPLKKEDRKKYTELFENGEIEVACVKDIFNEGIDIKQIDCLLILRPTDSSTIAIQQLGRGLRLSAGKNELRVLNFIGQKQRNPFLPNSDFIGDPELNEKGEYVYDNGNKVIFSKELVNIFQQQNALYSQSIDKTKIPSKWITWGDHIQKEIEENLYNKINKQNKNLQAQLQGCKFIYDNPEISGDEFKDKIINYVKKNNLPEMKAGIRAMTLSRALGLLTGKGKKKCTTIVFDKFLELDSDLKNNKKYKELTETQLQKICYWNTNAWAPKDTQNSEARDFSKLFKNFIFISLYKIILSIGYKSGKYQISYNEWIYFVIFCRHFNDTKEISENILDYRNEKEFFKIERFLKDSSKRMDERLSELFHLSSVLEFTKSTGIISFTSDKVEYVRQIVNNFEKKLKENKIPYPLENGERGEYEEMLHNPKPFWEDN